MTIDRFQVTMPGPLEIRGESTDPADWIAAGDLLVPRDVAVRFSGSLWERETMTRDARRMGEFRGLALISNGVLSIYRCEFSADLEAHRAPITARFLERVPLSEIALRVAARCALTRYQDAHYEVPFVPPEGSIGALIQEFNPIRRLVDSATLPHRQIRARSEDRPLPVDAPPRPVLIDTEGIPWYRVQVVERAVRSLSRRKQPRITAVFLADVWSAYQAAKKAGEPTTEAIRELGLARNGKVPGNTTVFRWIQQAREMYGQEAPDAPDE